MTARMTDVERGAALQAVLERFVAANPEAAELVLAWVMKALGELEATPGGGPDYALCVNLAEGYLEIVAYDLERRNLAFGLTARGEVHARALVDTDPVMRAIALAAAGGGPTVIGGSETKH